MSMSVQRRLAEIHQQRELLVERAAMQRGELAVVAEEFKRPMQLLHRIEALAIWMRDRPLATTAAMLTTALVMGRGRRWVERAVLLYELIRSLRQRLTARRETGIEAT